MTSKKKATLIRVLSSAIGLPIYLFTIISEIFFSITILINSLIISLVSMYEYYKITDRDDNGRAFMGIGLAVGLIFNVLVYLLAFNSRYGFSDYLKGFDGRIIMAVVIVFISIILVVQVFIRPIKGGIYSTAVTIFGFLFFIFSFSHIILMKALNNGVFYIIILNAIIMFNDTGAYFGGVLFGRHKVNFPVSPNKTWEGYFSGLLFGILAMVLTNYIYSIFFNLNLFSYLEAVILGAVFSILGSVGDLIESAIKRDSLKKDSGSIIPGHGGLWDVFDALIFTLPLFYYYLKFKGAA